MAKHDTLLINEVSRISQATQVRGSLVSQSDIRIDGTFEGDLITAGKLVLGQEQLIFPELQYDQVEKVRGFDICIVTTAKTDEEARELLKAMGMPFKAN